MRRCGWFKCSTQTQRRSASLLCSVLSAAKLRLTAVDGALCLDDDDVDDDDDRFDDIHTYVCIYKRRLIAMRCGRVTYMCWCGFKGGAHSSVVWVC